MNLAHRIETFPWLGILAQGLSSLHLLVWSQFARLSTSSPDIAQSINIGKAQEVCTTCATSAPLQLRLQPY